MFASDGKGSSSSARRSRTWAAPTSIWRPTGHAGPRDQSARTQGKHRRRGQRERLSTRSRRRRRSGRPAAPAQRRGGGRGGGRGARWRGSGTCRRGATGRDAPAVAPAAGPGGAGGGAGARGAPAGPNPCGGGGRGGGAGTSFGVVDLAAKSTRIVTGSGVTLSADGRTLAWLNRNGDVCELTTVTDDRRRPEGRAQRAPHRRPGSVPRRHAVAYQWMPNVDWEIYVADQPGRRAG